MASKTTGWLCTHTVSTAANSDPNKLNVTITCYWKNNGWNYNINNVSAWVYFGSQSYQVKNAGSINSTSGNYVSVSCGSHTFVVNKSTSESSVSCYAKITSNSSYVSGTKTSTATKVTIPAKTSYKVTFNANGGSGAPAAQTKWHGTNLTLSSTVPTRSGYSFQGWGTSSTDTTVDYKAGATYSANEAKTLYAIWKAGAYTVTFNANGGSLGSVPSTMSKTHGTTLTLSTEKPTRTNYIFRGWGTSASATTASYQPGGSYTTNAAITLYAIWEIGYTKPRITNVSIARVDANHNFDDSGTKLKVVFDWATDKSVTKIRIDGKSQTDTSWLGSDISASGTSGHVDTVIATLGGKAFDAEKTYQQWIQVSDSSGTSSVIITVPSMKLPIDVKAGGKGVAFGKTAELDDTAEFEYTIHAHNGIRYAVLPEETNFDNVKTPGAYPFGAASTYGYKQCPVDSDTSGTLEVLGSGDTTQLLQRITTCSKTTIQTWERCYHEVGEASWGKWTRSGARLPAISAYLASNQTTVAAAYTKINFGATNKTFGLTLSNGGVVIGDGISKVLVSLTVAFSGLDSNGNRHIRIKKNDGFEDWVSGYGVVSGDLTLNIPPRLITVAKDDVISAVYYSPVAGETISSGSGTTGWKTCLTVAAVM